jgi:hypothetical protein
MSLKPLRPSAWDLTLKSLRVKKSDYLHDVNLKSTFIKLFFFNLRVFVIS